jgi:hypothetical protein
MGGSDTRRRVSLPTVRRVPSSVGVACDKRHGRPSNLLCFAHRHVSELPKTVGNILADEVSVLPTTQIASIPTKIPEEPRTKTYINSNRGWRPKLARLVLALPPATRCHAFGIKEGR